MDSRGATQLVRIGADSPDVGPQPNMDNGGNWHHIASEREVKRAMGDRFATILECPTINMTFVISHVYRTVLRAGALGGSVRNIEGGWVYASGELLRVDAAEIRTLSRAAQG